MDEEMREKHYNVYDVDGFWEDWEISPESFDEATRIYRELDDVLLGKRK